MKVQFGLAQADYTSEAGATDSSYIDNSPTMSSAQGSNFLYDGNYTVNFQPLVPMSFANYSIPLQDTTQKASVHENETFGMKHTNAKPEVQDLRETKLVGGSAYKATGNGKPRIKRERWT